MGLMDSGQPLNHQLQFFAQIYHLVQTLLVTSTPRRLYVAMYIPYNKKEKKTDQTMFLWQKLNWWLELEHN